jgi:hypothetical protein
MRVEGMGKKMHILSIKNLKMVKVKVSRYTPWRHIGGEEV